MRSDVQEVGSKIQRSGTNVYLVASGIKCFLRRIPYVISVLFSCQKSKEAKGSEIQKKSEESKEDVLQDIRRKPAISCAKQLSKQEQQRRISEYDEHIRSMMSESSREILVNVQEQLLGLFSKLKVRSLDPARPEITLVYLCIYLIIYA